LRNAWERGYGVTGVKGRGGVALTVLDWGYFKRLLRWGSFTRKHCANAVKCLANAFDNCADVGFGSAEQFGGIEEAIITEYFTKAKPTQ